jgi:hypothetical protein
MGDADAILAAALRDERSAFKEMRQMEKAVARARAEILYGRLRVGPAGNPGAAQSAECCPPCLGRGREFEEAKRREVKEIRDFLNQQALRDELEGVEPADADAVAGLSAACNERLVLVVQQETGEASHTPWIRMFKRIDADGSGLISYTEFVGLIRKELGLTDAAFSALDIKRVWLAIDTDRSGRISAGEARRARRRHRARARHTDHGPRDTVPTARASPQAAHEPSCRRGRRLSVVRSLAASCVGARRTTAAKPAGASV